MKRVVYVVLSVALIAYAGLCAAMYVFRVVPGDAPFDLMVDDLYATHNLFTSLGLSPTPIEARPAIDHEVFRLREPAGHVITVFSSHVSGNPV